MDFPQLTKILHDGYISSFLSGSSYAFPRPVQRFPPKYVAISKWLKWCIEFGIEANAILVVPYDWRLSPSNLEERDLCIHKLKLTFETALKHRGGPSIVFAHS